MDVIEIARIVLRRWYVMVPVLLVTAALVFMVASTAESEYETGGSFLLTDASLVGGGVPAIGESSVSPLVVAEVVQGGASQMRVREQGGTASYEVAGSAAEGLVRITATGDSEQATITTVELVIEETQRELADRQDRADVPEQRRVTAEVLSSPASAQQQVVNEGTEDEALRYVATGALRFISPGDQGGNPYAASLTGTVRVLEEVLVSPQVRQEITAEGGIGRYEVGMIPRDTAPIVNVTAQSTSPQGAIDTLGVVVDRLHAELRQRQELAGVPPASMLTLEPLSVPVGVTLIGGELRRPLIMIIGLGLVAAVSLAMLVEGLATRSRRRQGGEWQPRAVSTPPVPEGRAAGEPKVAQRAPGA